MRQKLELIDWAERFPNESSLQISIRQSTYCLCGEQKEIGQTTCGCDNNSSRIVEFWYRASLTVDPLQGNGKLPVSQEASQ